MLKSTSFEVVSIFRGPRNSDSELLFLNFSAQRSSYQGIVIDISLDLRDPSTTPLNFTKSINLALSERGINAMRHAGQPKLIEHVMGATIPMRGRMIHGKRVNGDLYEESQDYDAHGRVRVVLLHSLESTN